MDYGNADYIKITGLKITAHHGVLPEEKERGQDFYINARLYCDMAAAAGTDRLSDALNYADCCHFIAENFTAQSFDLIETAAQRLCRALLLRYGKLRRVALEVCKPHAPIGLLFSDVCVHMERGWHTAYVAFGSNMGDREAWIDAGIERLRQSPDIRGIRLSERMETKPYGPVPQADFLNGCMELETLLAPEELLMLLHETENCAGRRRDVRWGPRTLDLDLIFYDKLVYESDDLIIPHVDMQNRSFVLQPLMQLCPNYRHPLLGLTVRQLLERLEAGSEGMGTKDCRARRPGVLN